LGLFTPRHRAMFCSFQLVCCTALTAHIAEELTCKRLSEDTDRGSNGISSLSQQPNVEQLNTRLLEMCTSSCKGATSHEPHKLWSQLRWREQLK
jgi:hypothetical protein